MMDLAASSVWCYPALTMARPGGLLSDLMVWTIRGYQKLVSRYTPPTCRFYPSCSHYAATALRVHGPARGGWLAFWRVMRCNPFYPGGHDPVPPRRQVSGESVD
jgi:hypothetical protein